jgi:hypothetical protein
LSLPPVASGGHAEVPVEDVLLAPSLLRIASLGFDEGVDDEKLAPQSLLASSKDVVSSSVRDTADVRHVEEVPAEPCGGLSAADVALGDEEGWVQVGRGGRPFRDPSSLLQNDGLERSLAFNRWTRGRCFRCLGTDHHIRCI